MQPGGYGPLETKKMLRERKNEQPKSHAFLPGPKDKFPLQKATPSSPSLSPPCGHGDLEGGFFCRRDKPSWLRQISTSEVGIREARCRWSLLPGKLSLWSSPTACNSGDMMSPDD
jgi:hypothetical protein